MMAGIYLHLCPTHRRHVTWVIFDHLDVNVSAAGKHLPLQLLDT